jgi:hypothetical protein
VTSAGRRSSPWDCRLLIVGCASGIGAAAGRPDHRHRPVGREVGQVLAVHSAHALAGLEADEQWTANRLGAFP